MNKLIGNNEFENLALDMDERIYRSRVPRHKTERAQDALAALHSALRGYFMAVMAEREAAARAASAGCGRAA